MNRPSILFSAVLLAAGTSVAMAQGPSDAQIAAIVVTANQVDIDVGKFAQTKAHAADVKPAVAEVKAAAAPTAAVVKAEAPKVAEAVKAPEAKPAAAAEVKKDEAKPDAAPVKKTKKHAKKAKAAAAKPAA